MRGLDKLYFVMPLYSDGFSHTDSYNKDGFVYYILRGQR